MQIKYVVAGRYEDMQPMMLEVTIDEQQMDEMLRKYITELQPKVLGKSYEIQELQVLKIDVGTRDFHIVESHIIIEP